MNQACVLTALRSAMMACWLARRIGTAVRRKKSGHFRHGCYVLAAERDRLTDDWELKRRALGELCGQAPRWPDRTA